MSTPNENSHVKSVVRTLAVKGRSMNISGPPIPPCSAIFVKKHLTHQQQWLNISITTMSTCMNAITAERAFTLRVSSRNTCEFTRPKVIGHVFVQNVENDLNANLS